MQTGDKSHVLSAPGIENYQSSDKSASSSPDLGNEQSKVSKFFGKLVAESNEIQNTEITKGSPQLGSDNLEVMRMARISAEAHSKNSKDSHNDHFKMSGFHLLEKVNSTESDGGIEKISSSSVIENVTYVDSNVNSGEEKKNGLQKTSSFVMHWKVSGKHVAKPRHLPYGATLSRHVRPKTVSSVSQTSTDHVSAQTSVDHISAFMDAQADSITNKKLDSVEVTELLVYAGDQLSKVEGSELDLKPSSDPMRKCNPKNLKIKTDSLAGGKIACQGCELMNMSLSVEVDFDCPLVDNDSMKASPVTETSICFENMSLLVPDEDADLIRKDNTSSETVAASDAVALLGGSELSSDAVTLLGGSELSSDAVALLGGSELSSDALALLGGSERSYTDCANTLMKVQQQSGGSSGKVVSTVPSKNDNSANLFAAAQCSSSVANNTIENMLQNKSAVNTSKSTRQQKSCVMITSSAVNSMQHQNCSTGDTWKDTLRSISSSVANDFVENVANSSENALQSSKAGNGSKDLQQEISSAMNTSTAQPSNNVAGVSKNREQKVNSATTASKTIQSNTALNPCLSAKQSKNVMDDSENKGQKVTTTATKSTQQQNGNAVDASKNKEQEVCRATTTSGGHTLIQDGCIANSSKNVQQKSIAAPTDKVQQVNSNAGSSFKSKQQQNGSGVSSLDAQQQNGNAACSDNVRKQNGTGADLSKGMQQENACMKLSQAVQKLSNPVFKHPDCLRSSVQGENLSSCARVPSGKIGLSQNQKSSSKTKKHMNTALSLLSDTNVSYQPLQECRDLLELASCKTTDYRVQRGKPKCILEEASRANAFDRFKHFRFSRATENDVLELYGRLPVMLPEDLEETPLCEEDITDFASKKNKVIDLEKLIQDQRQ